MAARKRGKAAKSKRAGAPKPAIDWDSIRAEWDEGQLSLPNIAATHGLSHNAILMRAKRQGWPPRPNPQVYTQAQAATSALEFESGEIVIHPAGIREAKLSFLRVIEVMIDQRVSLMRLARLGHRLENHLDKHITMAEARPGDKAYGGGQLRPDEMRVLAGVFRDLVNAKERLHRMIRLSFGIQDGEAPSEFDTWTPEQIAAIVALLRRESQA